MKDVQTVFNSFFGKFTLKRVDRSVAGNIGIFRKTVDYCSIVKEYYPMI